MVQVSLFIFSTFIQKNCNIAAIDGSNELIEFAQERYGKFPITFEAHNLHDFRSEKKYDIVICKDSFHHFHDPKRSLDELLNLLAPGGFLYIYDLARECPPNQILQRLEHIADRHEKKRFLQSMNASFTEEEMSALLANANATQHLIIYPLEFSNQNKNFHNEQIQEDYLREYRFDRLERICILQK